MSSNSSTVIHAINLCWITFLAHTCISFTGNIIHHTQHFLTPVILTRVVYRFSFHKLKFGSILGMKYVYQLLHASTLSYTFQCREYHLWEEFVTRYRRRKFGRRAARLRPARNQYKLVMIILWISYWYFFSFWIYVVLNEMWWSWLVKWYHILSGINYIRSKQEWLVPMRRFKIGLFCYINQLLYGRINSILTWGTRNICVQSVYFGNKKQITLITRVRKFVYCSETNMTCEWHGSIPRSSSAIFLHFPHPIS
jgi:hypothetical protein